MLALPWQSHPVVLLVLEGSANMEINSSRTCFFITSLLLPSRGVRFTAHTQHVCRGRVPCFWRGRVPCFWCVCSAHAQLCWWESYSIQSNRVQYLKDFTRWGSLGVWFNFTEQILPTLYSHLDTNGSNNQPVPFYFLYTGCRGKTVAMFKEVQV